MPYIAPYVHPSGRARRRLGVFIDLTGRRCVVVGGGPAGAEKATRLADAGATVTVVDPSPGQQVASDERLLLERRTFLDDDLAGSWLVVTATGDSQTNERVASAAEQAGVWANRADAADGGPAALGASLERGSVRVAVSTGGASPALGVWLRDRIAAALPPEVGRLAELLAERPRRAGERTHRGLPFDEALARVMSGDEAGARAALAGEER